MSGAPGGCDFQATLLRYRKTFEGGGTYVLSEYSIDGQGFRSATKPTGVVLHPVVYQFCANWGQTKKRELPPNFDSINKFCGMRFLFQSESREELRKLPGEHVTTYDRVLEKLIAKYGRPDGFARRGKVVIETMEGDSTDAGDRKFGIWRWCPAHGNGLHTTLHGQRGAVARSGDRQGHGAVFVAAALGVRLCARKLRLQGRSAVPHAARAELTTAQRAWRKVRL